MITGGFKSVPPAHASGLIMPIKVILQRARGSQRLACCCSGVIPPEHVVQVFLSLSPWIRSVAIIRYLVLPRSRCSTSAALYGFEIDGSSVSQWLALKQYHLYSQQRRPLKLFVLGRSKSLTLTRNKLSSIGV